MMQQEVQIQNPKSELSFDRKVALFADGADELLWIDTPAAIVGMPIDVVNWALKKVGLGTETPFLGSDYIKEHARNAYEGYYKLMGYSGSVAPKTKEEQLYSTAGKITGQVMVAAATMGSSLLKQKVAALPGETAAWMSVSKASTIEESSKKLSFMKKSRLVRRTDDLGLRLERLVEKGEIKSAEAFFERATRKSIDGTQAQFIMKSDILPDSMKKAAGNIKITELESGGLTNFFGKVTRNASYFRHQPLRASAEGAREALYTAKDAGYYVLRHPVKSGMRVAGAAGAGVTADLALNDGDITEAAADKFLDDGSRKADLAYALVSLSRTGKKAPKEIEEEQKNPNSKKTGGEISRAFKKAGSLAKDTAVALGLSGEKKLKDAIHEFEIPDWLRNMPIIGSAIWLFEKITELFNKYVKPLFTSTDKGHVVVQGDAGRRLANIANKNAPDANRDSTIAVVGHKHEEGQPAATQPLHMPQQQPAPSTITGAELRVGG